MKPKESQSSLESQFQGVVNYVKSRKTGKIENYPLEFSATK